MIEQWKKIDGFPNYEVSNLGRLMSFDGKVLKGGFTRGYRHFILCENGVKKNERLSRLVAIAFIPNPENKPQVNHINGNKGDDRAENLEWCTGLENVEHAWKNGLVTSEKMSGENCVHSRMTEKQVRIIKHALSFGVRGTAKWLATMCGVGEKAISKIARGTNWEHIKI